MIASLADAGAAGFGNRKPLLTKNMQTAAAALHWHIFVVKSQNW